MSDDGIECGLTWGEIWATINASCLNQVAALCLLIFSPHLLGLWILGMLVLPRSFLNEGKWPK